MSSALLVSAAAFVGVSAASLTLWTAVSSLATDTSSSWIGVVTRRLARLAMPEENQTLDEVQLSLVRAGIERPASDVIFFAVRTGLGIAGPTLGLVLFQPDEVLTFVAVIAVGGAVGYLLPRVWLDRRIEDRQAAVREALPAFLDMLVPVLDAGLSVDLALRYVAEEITRSHPAFAQILARTLGRIDAGQSRDRAFNDLLERTGVEELEPIVHLILRAERSGSGIRDALAAHEAKVREHTLRQAEQQMARVGPYLTVAAILFVLPLMLVVIVGPAVYQVVEVIFPVLAGGGR